MATRTEIDTAADEARREALRAAIVAALKAHGGNRAAKAAAITPAARGSDPVRVTGEIDGVRYGAVLRSRQLVGVRGMGLTWDGLYAVEQVTHRLSFGEYKQNFRLKRGGFISPTPAVVP